MGILDLLQPLVHWLLLPGLSSLFTVNYFGIARETLGGERYHSGVCNETKPEQNYI